MRDGMPDLMEWLAVACDAAVRWGLVALLAFTPLAFGSVEALHLEAADDPQIRDNISVYPGVLDAIIAEPL